MTLQVPRDGPSTQAVHRRVALVCDFDDTLGPDTTSSFLESIGADVEPFWRGVDALVRQGWDPVPAQLWRLVETSRASSGPRLTRDVLRSFGARHPLFPGVPGFLERLRARAAEANPRVVVELYVVSCGLGEIVRASAVAPLCEAIWANELHWDEQSGEALFPSRIVSHTEKTKYLRRIAKGALDDSDPDADEQAWREVDRAQARIPLSQMIYVGDGLTDIPCFALLRKEGGVAIGVYKERSAAWSRRNDVGARARVANLAKADFREGGELMQSLDLAVDALCKLLAVRERSAGE